jgi:putative ABC transport system permease protein
MLNDLRYALRQLLRAPGFSVTALLTIALGIGACTAIFSVVSGVLLRPMPYPESDRLVVVRETNPPQFESFSVAPGQYFTWQAHSSSWQSLAALRNSTYNLTGQGEPQRLRAVRVTANYFSTLGVRPMLGRDFTAAEDTPGNELVVILSHGFWQQQFGGRRDILHKKLILSGQAHLVVGVLPPIGDQPRAGGGRRGQSDIYTPAAYTVEDREQRGGHYIAVLGRLKPGVTVAQAQSEMSVIADRLARQYPDTNKGWGVKLTPMLEAAVGDVRPILLSLLAAVGFLLLIACANVANLLLVRGTARARELAVRGALGAARGRLLRQLTTESVLLALLGSALGVLVAWAGVAALMAFAPASLPRVQEVAIDLRALGFSLALALLTGVGFGLVPALQVTGGQLHDTLKQGGRGAGESAPRHRLRAVLVVTEMAIALVLLVGAGLLMRSFLRLQQVDPGFDPRNALAIRLALPEKKYEIPGSKVLFVNQAVRTLGAVPGVQVVGATHVAPLSGSDYMLTFSIRGRPPLAAYDLPSANYYSVSPDYFRAMGIKLLRGRFFQASDTPDSEPVAIVSESMARKHFPGEEALGKVVNISSGPERWSRIVGVVGDVRQYSLDGEVAIANYEPLAQVPFESLIFIVRSSGPVAGLPAALRKAVYAVDSDQPVANIQPLTEWVAESTGRQRFAMLLFLVFSAAALLLAAIGIYGVMAYSVRQRTPEIGIRMALGASSAEVLRLVFVQGGRLIALGLALGLAGALVLTRFLSTLLFGVSAHDPLTFAAISFVLVLTAALACLLPARRASAVDPMTALRSD